MATKPGCPNEYSLKGNQVEPRASYWNYCPQLRSVHVDELRLLTDNPKSPHYFPPYPTNPKVVEGEFDELLELAQARDNPCDLVSSRKGRERLPISRLLNISPPPLGALVVNRFPGEQIIRTAAVWRVRSRRRRPDCSTVTR